jgi:AcrR family transcriptional regulator
MPEASEAKIGRPRNPAADDAIRTAVLDLVHSGATLSSISFVSIAQRTGFSRNSLYRRWKTKEDLYSDVVVSMKRSQPVFTGQSARENLIALLHANFGRRAEQNELRMAGAIVAESQNFPDLHEQYLIEIVAPFDEAFKLAIRRGKETGEIRVDIDEDLLTEVLTSFVHSVTSSMVQVEHDRESLIGRTTDLVFDGISPT